ncbi:MAG: HAMP domain-containing histidine kinase [Lachnospiraceae bacterium]|nr:HAMP domain-containing histidine kinase [Lachnospiraceae bacterium]
MNNREYRNTILISAVIILLAFTCGTALVSIKAGLLLLVSGAALLAVFVFYTRKRYRHITELNDYLVKVLAGAEAPEIGSQEEGELSILRTNIYKAATMLKTQNEQLADDRTQLAAALADISHQLKTPLTSMMVMNDLLMEETDEAKREELLRTQSAQLDRMNWLIQTLLKISKLDAGTIVLKKEAVPFSELTEEAVRPFLVQMDVRNIVCRQDVSEEMILCDRNWTVEALQNIIKNCIEHMDDGGTLFIETNDTHLFGQITIRDNGCGIPAEDLPHIFERFYKGKNAGKDSVGIGLALSKRILEGEHGEITVQSTEGVGTSFSIRIYKTII